MNNFLREFLVATRIASSIACILLVIVLHKSKQLRKSRNYIYLLNYGITWPLSTVAVFACEKCIFSFPNIPLELFCFLNGVITINNFPSVILMVGLSFDWFMVSVNPELMNKFPRAPIFMIIICYILSFIQLLAYACICTLNNKESILYDIISNLIYFILIVIMTPLNLLVFIRKPTRMNNASRSWLSLVLSNVVIFPHLAQSICRLVHEIAWFQYDNNDSFLLRCLFTANFTAYYLCAEIVFSCTPILVVYLLWRFNKYFKMSFLAAFKCSNESYEQTDLDEDSDIFPSENNPMDNNVPTKQADFVVVRS